MSKSPTKMFPPNLQKNIWELNRQISLLEVECESIESKKKEASTTTNKSSKSLEKEQSSRPYVSKSNFSNNFCSPNKIASTQLLLAMYSSDGVSLKTNKKAKNFATEKTNLGSSQENNFKVSKHSAGEDIRKKEKKKLDEDTYSDKSQGNEKRKLGSKVSFGSVKEGSESSEEAFPVSKSMVGSKRKKNGLKISEDQNRCSRESQTDPLGIKSSDETVSCDETEDKNINEKWRSNSKDPLSNQNRGLIKKRRPRSARTRKNYLGDIPFDIHIKKALQEKEIQCMLWNEEKEKAEFLVDLNDTITILHALIDELKATSTQEKRNEIRDEMQNTLLKISGIKSINALNNPLSWLTPFGAGQISFLEGNGSIKEVKNILQGVKQFCTELSSEKSVLVEEIAAKNRTIESMKNSEKEYLALISSLKYNLEKVKEEAEEGSRAQRDFIIAKTKLQEEKKVIEALKKSHGKMQELVENYVLENDKLRTQFKMARLETQKYTVLLAGKEVEITKYKKDIASFQRQISEQLNLLRSKAAESQPEASMKAIAMFSPTEGDSCMSETTCDNNEFEEPSSPASTRTSVDALPMGNGDSKSVVKIEEEGYTKSVSKNSTSNIIKENDGGAKDGGFTTCQSDDSEEEARKKSKKFDFGLDKVFGDSKQLRENINEILNDMAKERSEKESQSSCNTSHCTTVSTSTVNSSECSHKE